MKKLLLSLTMLSIICASSAKVNNVSQQVYNGDELKKQVEKYAKDSLSKKFNQYKPINTIVTDTFTIRDLYKNDSVLVSALIERESSPFVILTQRELVGQEIEFRKRIAPNMIDYKAVKMYQKSDLKVQNIANTSKENFKKINLDKEGNAVMHIFEYTDKKGFSITDSAMFIYSPETIRMVSNAGIFNKGINFGGTIKSINNYMAEMMAKLPKQQRPSQNQQPANKE